MLDVKGKNCRKTPQRSGPHLTKYGRCLEGGGKPGATIDRLQFRPPTVYGILSARTDFLPQAALAWPDRSLGKVGVLSSAGLESTASRWLVENGPRELELLFRSIIYHPSAPILITDDDGNSRDASAGASKLLGLPREKIIGRPVDEFAQPAFKPRDIELWRALQEQGEQAGTLHLVGPDAAPRDVEYTAKVNVLPVRHVLVLRDKLRPPRHTSATDRFLPGCRTTLSTYWISRGELSPGIREQRASTAIKPKRPSAQHVSFLYPGDDTLQGRLQEEFEAGHCRRPYGDRRLAGEKRRVTILGQRHYDGAQGRKRRIAGLCAGGARF